MPDPGRNPMQAQRPEPPLARPGAWAGLWRRMAVKAALAARPG
jgi:hypothetical protein